MANSNESLVERTQALVLSAGQAGQDMQQRIQELSDEAFATLQESRITRSQDLFTLAMHGFTRAMVTGRDNATLLSKYWALSDRYNITGHPVAEVGPQGFYDRKNKLKSVGLINEDANFTFRLHGASDPAIGSVYLPLKDHLDWKPVSDDNVKMPVVTPQQELVVAQVVRSSGPDTDINADLALTDQGDLFVGWDEIYQARIPYPETASYRTDSDQVFLERYMLAKAALRGSLLQPAASN
jgi:hypothetical protein